MSDFVPVDAWYAGAHGLDSAAGSTNPFGFHEVLGVEPFEQTDDGTRCSTEGCDRKHLKNNELCGSCLQRVKKGLPL